MTPALRAAVDALARLVIGDDPAQIEAMRSRASARREGSGPGSICTLAPSARHMPSWDLKDKAACKAD